MDSPGCTWGNAMKGNTYTKGYQEALDSAKTQRRINVGLGFAVIILALMAFNQRERVVVVPPAVNAKLEIGWNSADQDYYKKWGLYVATFMGNLNPGNAAFIEEGLQMQFSPALYTELKKDIMDQAENLRATGRSLHFYPDKVIYERTSGKTFVTGKQEVISSAGSKTEQEVVYELQIGIFNGIPQVTAYEHYAGAPRTLDWLAKHRTVGGGS